MCPLLHSIPRCLVTQLSVCYPNQSSTLHVQPIFKSQILTRRECYRRIAFRHAIANCPSSMPRISYNNIHPPTPSQKTTPVGSPKRLLQYVRSYRPYLEAMSSITNEGTRHAVVTRGPLYPVMGYHDQGFPHYL